MKLACPVSHIREVLKCGSMAWGASSALRSAVSTRGAPPRSGGVGSASCAATIVGPSIDNASPIASTDQCARERKGWKRRGMRARPSSKLLSQIPDADISPGAPQSQLTILTQSILTVVNYSEQIVASQTRYRNAQLLKECYGLRKDPCDPRTGPMLTPFRR